MKVPQSIIYTLVFSRICLCLLDRFDVYLLPFDGNPRSISGKEYLHDGKLITLRIHPAMAEVQLKSFFGKLRYFVHDTIFEYRNFLLDYPTIVKNLEGIYELVGPDTEWAHEFDTRLKFASHLLQTMADAANLLTFYRLDTGVALAMIHKIIQLNVKLLSLRDTSGRPDIHAYDYARTVRRYISKILSWGELFLKFSTQPLSISMVFSGEFEKACKTLSEFASVIINDSSTVYNLAYAHNISTKLKELVEASEKIQ